MPDSPWSHLIASAGYTIGFVIIVLGRQQLFTESTLTAVLPVLTRRDGSSLRAMLRLWAVVLAANIAGTWLFAATLAFGEPFRPEVTRSLIAVATEAVQGNFGATVLKGVFAGWLIALMVWLLPSALSAKLFVIMLLTWLVALARLSHIIAGSSDAAYAVLMGQRSAGEYWLVFFLPTLIGNTLGGACAW